VSGLGTACDARHNRLKKPRIVKTEETSYFGIWGAAKQHRKKHPYPNNRMVPTGGAENAVVPAVHAGRWSDPFPALLWGGGEVNNPLA
jgi:hypothetical protein